MEGITILNQLTENVLYAISTLSKTNFIFYELYSMYRFVFQIQSSTCTSNYLSSYENFVKLRQSEETICTKDVAYYIL